ncbi:hypothetical protein P4O66_013380, partial [Electrophorus voltai]
MKGCKCPSQGKEPLAPKVPPKALPSTCHSGASRLPCVAHREVSLLSDEDTPSPKARSPRAHAPMPKPHRGKKSAPPVATCEMNKSAGVLPDTCAPKPEQPPPPELTKDDPHQAGRIPNQPTTGGLAGAPAVFPRLFNDPARADLCRVIQSSSLAAWSGGCSLISWRTGSHAVGEGLCH